MCRAPKQRSGEFTEGYVKTLRNENKSLRLKLAAERERAERAERERDAALAVQKPVAAKTFTSLAEYLRSQPHDE